MRYLKHNKYNDNKIQSKLNQVTIKCKCIYHNIERISDLFWHLTKLSHLLLFFPSKPHHTSCACVFCAHF